MKKALHLLIFVLLLCPAFVFAQVDLQNGLLLYYPFSGNVNDQSGNGVNGTIHGSPALTSDRFNGTNSAYSFNGTSDYISIPVSTIMPSVYSYSLWADPASTSGVSSLLSIGGNSYDQDILISPFDGWTGGGYNADNTSSVASSGVVPSTDTWYHIVVTRDNSNVQLFVNGTLAASISTTGEPTSYGTTPVASIGKRSDVNMQFYSGKIDEVRIYNRVLNSQEVTALYNESQSVQAVNKGILDQGFNILPNPSNGNFRIDLPTTLENCEINIQNTFGETVFTENLGNISGSTSINIGNKTQGIYLLTIKSNQGIASRRIVIQ